MFSSTPHPAKKLHTVWTTLFVVWGWGLLTHRGRDKVAAVFQTALSNVYSWMKMYVLRLRFHWNLFLRFVLIIFQHWFRYWLDADQATNHYMNQWWLVYWRIYASPGLNEWSQYSPSRYFKSALHWRHNDQDGVSNHQPHGRLLNRLFRRRSKKTSKFRVTGLCVGTSPGTGEFPAQMASNAENVYIWWHHYGWHQYICE